MTACASRCLLKMLDQPGERNRHMPVAMCSDSLCHGRVDPVRPALIRGPFQRHRRVVGNFDDGVEWSSLPVGSSLEIPSGNTLIGCYTLVEPRSGTVGGEAGSRELYRHLFGRWCSYDRISTCINADMPDDLRLTEQPVNLCITDQIPDEIACSLFVT